MQRKLTTRAQHIKRFDPQQAFLSDVRWQDVSTSVHLGTFTFPNRADYTRYFAKLGLHNVWENEQFVIAIQRDWHRRGQSGCLFSQVLVRKCSGAAWRRIVVPGTASTIDAEQVKTRIEAAIRESVALPECELLSLLFPQITTDRDLIALIRMLLQLEGMFLFEASEYEGRVRLSLRLPINQEGVQAWPLGYGPFPFFSKTRQAPVTEFTIRPKPKPAGLHPLLTQSRADAHLADVPPRLNDQQFLHSLHRTKERARTFEPPKGHRAAKITFMVPKLLWLCSGITSVN